MSATRQFETSAGKRTSIGLALLLLIVGLICFGLGLGVGHGFREELREERRMALAAQQSRIDPDLTPAENARICTVAIDRRVLRAELEEALAQTAAPSSAAANEAAATPTPAPSASPEQQAAFDKASAGVDEIIRRGSVSHEQAPNLRALIANVDPESQRELVSRIVRAVNQDKLKLEPGEAPF
jgi:hypothetical protein